MLPIHILTIAKKVRLLLYPPQIHQTPCPLQLTANQGAEDEVLNILRPCKGSRTRMTHDEHHPPSSDTWLTNISQPAVTIRQSTIVIIIIVWISTETVGINHDQSVIHIIYQPLPTFGCITCFFDSCRRHDYAESMN